MIEHQCIASASTFNQAKPRLCMPQAPLTQPPFHSYKVVHIYQLQQRATLHAFLALVARLSCIYGSRNYVCCRFDAKCKRIQAESPHGRRPAWAVRPVIVKSGDDCRQELLAVQLISTFYDIFQVLRLCHPVTSLCPIFTSGSCRQNIFCCRPTLLCFSVIDGFT